MSVAWSNNLQRSINAIVFFIKQSKKICAAKHKKTMSISRQKHHAKRWLLISLSFLFTASCSQESNESAPTERSNRGGSAPAVEIVQAKSGSLPLEQRLTGSVKARNQTQIYAEVSGPIVEVFINDGDFVAAGDKLLRIRDTDYRARLNQATAGEQIAAARVQQVEANLSRLQTQAQRIETLANRQLASPLELENARVDLLSAQADLEMAKAQQRQAEAIVREQLNALSNTIVRAPISGVVGSRNAEVGQQVTDNTPLFDIGDPQQMRVRVTLTEAMLRQVTADTRAVISTGSTASNEGENKILAKVSRVSPFLNPVTHTTEAEIDIPEHNNFLQPGMYVTVDLIYGESLPATLIPNSAIYQHPRLGSQGVFLISANDEKKDGSVSTEIVIGTQRQAPLAFTPIDIIARGRMSSAVSGINEGDWVVTIGHYLLSSQGSTKAQVQATDWNHILQLQQVQNRDLLETIMRKDQAPEHL